MKVRTVKILRYLVVAGTSWILLAVFWPKHYPGPPLAELLNTQFWKLPTGSTIAYYKLEGKGVKKPYPIIYLHGGPGGPISALNINTLGAFAEDGFDVYLYDQIGGGHSARLVHIAEYSAERHKKDLEEIVQIIGKEKVILIGQSWGAILATLYAAEHPDKVDRIVFTCPGPIQPLLPGKRRPMAPDSLHLKAPAFSNAQGNKTANNIRTRAMAYFAQSFGVKLAPDAEADAFATFLNSYLNRSQVCDTTKMVNTVGGAGYYVSIMTVNSFKDIPDPRSKLKTAPYPILVVKGQCDSQSWATTQEYLDIFPHPELVVIPNAGHAVAFEQPELYLQAIRRFLLKSPE